jgi:transcriptional regulator GlxA family with amidase domain
MLSNITGAFEVFLAANFMKSIDKLTDNLFDIHIASVTGKPVIGFGNIQITPHRSIQEIEHTDFIMIPGIVPSNEAQQKNNDKLIQWLKHQYNKNALISSVCTGAFLLAETGLLDGKTVSTNWMFADLFRKRFPNIRLETEKLITEEDGIITTGAATAYLDLCLYIIEKFGSQELAALCSKAMLIDPNRKAQAPYIIFNFQKNHSDSDILEAQKWMENQFSQTSVSIDKVAKYLGMSPRNFNRRFKNATGDTPNNYLQRVRVESAKRMLETTRKTIDEISYQVGYEDSNSFRKIFRKYTQLSPNLYRGKFSRMTDSRVSMNM